MDAAAPKRNNTSPSCTVCQRRKVKCNRVYPCAACTKTGLDCQFPPPGTHGKRKRPSTTTAIEELHTPTTVTDPDNTTNNTDNTTTTTTTIPLPSLKSGIRSVSSDFPSPESTTSYGHSTARLVSEGTGYRYVNNHLWNAISTDPHAHSLSPAPSPHNPRSSPAGSRSGQTNPEDAAAIAARSDAPVAGRSFIFGLKEDDIRARPTAVVDQAPASHIVFLWQTFQANVDPMMKISHAPSVQHIILGQVGRPALAPNELALTSAIYYISVVSLTDEQCKDSLSESRATLLRKFRDATETALSVAGFITTTDILVLQALVYYLTALRSVGEIQSVWSLLGIAVRIAGTLGLARDGSALGLSPFDTEMRRRLWWGIVYLDGRMAEVVGQDGDLMGASFDAGPPSNLNDSELFPNMIRLPETRRGPSEAIHLQARVLSITVARSLQSITGPQGTWHRLHDATMSTAEKIDIMRHIERRYHEEILQICDPTVPLQWLSINTAKTFSTKLRLIARIPIVDMDREWENADGFSENAFLLSMDLLQIQLDLWCEPSVQHWKWHWQAHFQWYALVTLLRQTRLRRSGHGASRAWSLIKKAFDIIIPSLQLGPRKSLLLDGIHALLEAAKRQRERPDFATTPRYLDSHRAAAPSREIVDPCDRSDHHHHHHHHHPHHLQPLDPVSVTLPPLRSPTGSGTPYGSRPHTAVLPSIDPGPPQMPTPTPFARSYAENHSTDQTLGFDLESIDWDEFDRLATELCQ